MKYTNEFADNSLTHIKRYVLEASNDLKEIDVGRLFDAVVIIILEDVRCKDCDLEYIDKLIKSALTQFSKSETADEGEVWLKAHMECFGAYSEYKGNLNVFNKK